MTFLRTVLVIVVGYLLGSLSFSIILSRILGRDIRSQGSGNAGATNMARVFGWGAGAGTLMFDMLKAIVAMLIGRALLGEAGVCAGGIACMVGHCWPVFYHFKGGKGISAGAAVALMIDWRVLIAVLVIFFAVAVISKKVSLGSICASIGIFFATLIFAPRLPMLLLAFVGMCIAVYRHKENILRLRAGTEPDFHAARSGTGKQNYNGKH
jgi:glycerol-3-phosphate acyltransferase PlsY